MKPWTRWAPAVAIGVILTLTLSAAAEACPGCKEAVAAQKNGANLVSGFQYSIVFMMAMPFTLLGLFCGYMYWEVKKAHARQAAEASRQAGSSVSAGSSASEESRAINSPASIQEPVGSAP